MAAEACWRPGCVASVAGHAGIAVSEILFLVWRACQSVSIFSHQLGAKRFWIEMNAAGRDGVDGLNDFPFFVGIGHRTLKDLAVAVFEATQSPRRSKRVKSMA